MASERVLRALLRFGVDPKSIDDVRRGVKTVEGALEDAGKKGDDAFRGMGNSAQTLNTILTGALIGGVLSLTNSLTNMARQGIGAFKALGDEAIGVNKSFETYVTQFETFLKSRPAAEGMISQLQAFNIATPFELPQLVEGAKLLQTFGGAQLNVAENWKIIGDASASVNRPFERTAFWVGRLYSNLQAGRPFGEAAMALQEMGIVTGELRTKLEDMQKAGASSTDIWAAFTAEISTKFEGGAGRLSKTLEGIQSNLADTKTELLRVGGEPYFEATKEDAQAFLDLLSDPAMNNALKELAVGLGEMAASAKQVVSSGVFESLSSVDPETIANLGAALQDASEGFGALSEIDLGGGKLNTVIELLTSIVDSVTLIRNLSGDMIGLTGGVSTFFDAMASGAGEALDVIKGIIIPGYQMLDMFETLNDSVGSLTGTNLTGWLRDATDATSSMTEAQERARDAESERMAGLADYYQTQQQATDATKEDTAAQEAAADALEKYKAALDKVNDAERKLGTDARRKRADAAQDTADKLTQLERDTTQNRLDAALDYERKVMDVEEELARKREDVARESAQRVEDVRRENANNSSDVNRDYRNKIADIDRDLANERVRIEVDFRKKLRDIRQRFDQDAEDAVRNQDAFAFVKAQRNRDNALAAAAQERNDSIAAAQQTAQEKRDQAQVDREKELEDLRIELERKLEEERISRQRQMEEAAQDADRKRQDAQTGYDQELADISTAEERKKQAIIQANQQKLAEIQKYYNRRLVDLRAQMEKELAIINEYEAKKARAASQGVSSAGGANYGGYSQSFAEKYQQAFGKRASGGYADKGVYQLGEKGREYVMNAAVTRQMEGALGGNITAGGLAAMAGRQVQMNNTFQFSERDDARYIMGQVEQIINNKILQAERGY